MYIEAPGFWGLERIYLKRPIPQDKFSPNNAKCNDIRKISSPCGWQRGSTLNPPKGVK